MKIFVLCNSDILATNTIHALAQSKQLAGIGVPNTHATHLSMVFQSIGISQNDIHVLEKAILSNQLAALIQTLEPDCILTLTFPWKIPVQILNQCKHGCINFHFGKLPDYRGADPIFWQLKNQEATGGISVHIMNEKIDEGAILHFAELPIMPGETYGMHSIRLAILAAEIAGKLWTILQMPAQEQFISGQKNFFKSPDQQNITINWQLQTAASIIALVNAANPKYLGAISYIRQQLVRILEVDTVNVNSTEKFAPGTIVHADKQNGLIVACCDEQFISIQIVQVKEGYLSGYKLFTLGLSIGEKFG